MPMSSGGPVASSSGCATRPRAQEIGLTGSAAPTQPSSLIGRYVMATAEHREPCESTGHARFWERPEVKVLRATRHFRHSERVPKSSGISQLAEVHDWRSQAESSREPPDGTAVEVPAAPQIAWPAERITPGLSPFCSTAHWHHRLAASPTDGAHDGPWPA